MEIDNRKYRPFRDKKTNHTRDRTIPPPAPATTTITKKKLTETDIREKVKKQMSKTQRDSRKRRVKKGEAGSGGQQRRENMNTINHDW